MYSVFRDTLHPVRVDLLTVCRISCRIYLCLCYAPTYISCRKLHKGRFRRSSISEIGIEWSIGGTAYCVTVCLLTVFQESFRTALFLTDLEMNGPVGRRCSISLDMLFLEVFYTTLSLNKRTEWPKKCIHSLLINIFGINLNEISISG